MQAKYSYNFSYLWSQQLHKGFGVIRGSEKRLTRNDVDVVVIPMEFDLNRKLKVNVYSTKSKKIRTGLHGRHKTHFQQISKSTYGTTKYYNICRYSGD